MDYVEYRNRRLRRDPELEQAYEQEKVKRECTREFLRTRLIEHSLGQGSKTRLELNQLAALAKLDRSFL